MDEHHAGAQAPRRRLVLLGGTAATLAALTAPRRATAQVGAQQDWRFCGKCSAMFWDGTGDKGRCPAGGGHLAQGFNFTIHYDAGRGGASQSQYDWRFCGKCKAMYWDGSASKGHCPAGGGHQANGFNFGLNFNHSTGTVAQSDWRFCQRCNDLFWNGGPNKGLCPAGGGHVAQGFTFDIPFIAHPEDPGKLVAEAVGMALPQALTAVQPVLVQLLGAADLLGKGYTLHDINLRFGQTNVQDNAGAFDVTLTDSYLYVRVTQPSLLGAYADPAFEIHFDARFHGAVQRLGSGKLRAENVVAEVTRILVKPRDVTGGIVTTVVRFFQMTNYGGKLIQQGMDRLKVDLTDRINAYLQTFS